MAQNQQNDPTVLHSILVGLTVYCSINQNVENLIKIKRCSYKTRYVVVFFLPFYLLFLMSKSKPSELKYQTSLELDHKLW